MTHSFGSFRNSRKWVALTLWTLLASTSAQSGHPALSLAESVPAQWRQLVAAACLADPVKQRPLSEAYYSNHVGYQKLLLLGPDGNYRLMRWVDNDQTGRMYVGAYQRNSQRITLDMEMNAQSSGGDDSDAVILPSFPGHPSKRLGLARILQG